MMTKTPRRTKAPCAVGARALGEELGAGSVDERVVVSEAVVRRCDALLAAAFVRDRPVAPGAGRAVRKRQAVRRAVDGVCGWDGWGKWEPVAVALGFLAFWAACGWLMGRWVDDGAPRPVAQHGRAAR